MGNFKKQTIEDIDLKGKRVLLRADYNVPLSKDGKITSDYRVKMSLPTIKYLLKQNCSIVICSHLGRPERFGDPKTSLEVVAKRLAKLLDKQVQFVNDCVGEEVREACSKLERGNILLLENLRYHDEEEQNDAKFAKQIVEDTGAEVFVQDGFGVVHRAHASTSAITKLLPSVAGLLLAKEMTVLTEIVEKPKRPLLAIVGGAKISDKIEIIERFISLADAVVIGGAMANTFLKSEGIQIGDSLYDKDDLPLARRILTAARSEAKKRRFIFYLPQDAVVATKIDRSAKTRVVDFDAHEFASIEAYPKRPDRKSGHVLTDEKILDIGPFSGAFIAGLTQLSETVLWNGTMGVTEVDGVQGPIGPFAHGSELVIEALLGEFGHKPFSVVGGGDTTGYVEERELTDCFSHVSTGGGASLEVLSGKKLPGVESLKDKR